MDKRPGGETGRRTGLKIPGLERDVPVQFRSRAPGSTSLTPSQMVRRGFHRRIIEHRARVWTCCTPSRLERRAMGGAVPLPVLSGSMLAKELQVVANIFLLRWYVYYGNGTGILSECDNGTRSFLPHFIANNALVAGRSCNGRLQPALST